MGLSLGPRLRVSDSRSLWSIIHSHIHRQETLDKVLRRFMMIHHAASSLMKRSSRCFERIYCAVFYSMSYLFQGHASLCTDCYSKVFTVQALYYRVLARTCDQWFDHQSENRSVACLLLGVIDWAEEPCMSARTPAQAHLNFLDFWFCVNTSRDNSQLAVSSQQWNGLVRVSILQNVIICHCRIDSDRLWCLTQCRCVTHEHGFKALVSISWKSMSHRYYCLQAKQSESRHRSIVNIVCSDNIAKADTDP